MSSGSQLGTGPVTVLPGGWLAIYGTNAVQAGQKITLAGNANVPAVLAIQGPTYAGGAAGNGGFDAGTIIGTNSTYAVIASLLPFFSGASNYRTFTENTALTLSGLQSAVVRGRSFPTAQYSSNPGLVICTATIALPKDNTYRFDSIGMSYTTDFSSNEFYTQGFIVSTALVNNGTNSANLVVEALPAMSNALDQGGIVGPITFTSTTSTFSGNTTVDKDGWLFATSTLGNSAGTITLGNGALVASGASPHFSKGAVTFNSCGVLGAYAGTMSVASLTRGGYNANGVLVAGSSGGAGFGTLVITTLGGTGAVNVTGSVLNETYGGGGAGGVLANYHTGINSNPILPPYIVASVGGNASAWFAGLNSSLSFATTAAPSTGIAGAGVVGLSSGSYNIQGSTSTLFATATSSSLVYVPAAGISGLTTATTVYGLRRMATSSTGGSGFAALGAQITIAGENGVGAVIINGGSQEGDTAGALVTQTSGVRFSPSLNFGSNEGIIWVDTAYTGTTGNYRSAAPSHGLGRHDHRQNAYAVRSEPRWRHSPGQLQQQLPGDDRQ